jgi:hypothetical protein
MGCYVKSPEHARAGRRIRSRRIYDFRRGLAVVYTSTRLSPVTAHTIRVDLVVPALPRRIERHDITVPWPPGRIEIDVIVPKRIVKRLKQARDRANGR